MASTSHLFVTSPLGTVALVWREHPALKVVRVLLPCERDQLERTLGTLFPRTRLANSPTVAELGARLQAFLEGQAVRFDLNLLALEDRPKFQQQVLLADYGIPRGRISTYGRIASKLGVPKGARAVGGALAHNPFPLIIPCHRVLGSDGGLGGFQGGLPMKRKLLDLEGVPFSDSGKVPRERFYY
jgi:methylated-DNA-[protein]-cysteine S-methyltransferase